VGSKIEGGVLEASASVAA